jgi:hypothetical protein
MRRDQHMGSRSARRRPGLQSGGRSLRVVGCCARGVQAARRTTTYKFPCRTLLKQAVEFACPDAPGPASNRLPLQHGTAPRGSVLCRHAAGQHATQARHWVCRMYAHNVLLHLSALDGGTYTAPGLARLHLRRTVHRTAHHTRLYSAPYCAPHQAVQCTVLRATPGCTVHRTARHTRLYSAPYCAPHQDVQCTVLHTTPGCTVHRTAHHTRLYSAPYCTG